MCAEENPKVDPLGQTVVLTGLQQYIRANMALFRANAALIDDPAAVTPYSDATIGATATAGTPTMAITFVVPSADQVLTFFCGQQVSAGVRYFSNWKWLASVVAGATSPLNVLSAYTTLNGALIEGKRIFLRAAAINECGVMGPFIETSIVVAA